MIHPVLTALLDAHAKRRSVVFTSLVETRGSTPQKAGAAMLVFENGDQIGTLGGGCVEAEVKRKALESLASTGPIIETFQLNHDYGWDDGLICGGRMTMLIEPISPEFDISYYESYLNLLEAGAGCTEIVCFNPDNEHEIQISPGSRFLFDVNNELVSQSAEYAGSDELRSCLKSLSSRPRPYHQHGFAFLPHLATCQLFIIGAGHVGKKLAEYAADVDFEVTVVDDREIYCNADNIPQANNWITGDFDEVLPDLRIDANSFCVIVTRGHNHDEQALFHLIKKSPRFLGMIGSKRKIKLIFDDLRQQGIDPGLLETVHAPIGFDINSQTVPEIAISIVAQLIAARNQETSTSRNDVSIAGQTPV